MLCPVCKTKTLALIDLAEGLRAMECSRCCGDWVETNAYLAWRKGLAGDRSPAQEDATIDASWDVDELKLCPHSGHIMGRYRILADVEFYLDRCGHCGGIWFDKREWAALVEGNLHDHVPEFLSPSWQKAIRSEEARIHMDRFYQDKFGAEDYEHGKRVREWLTAHPRRDMLLAFLQAEDPYEV